MRVFAMPKDPRRRVVLFPKNKSEALTEMVFDLMPSTGSVEEFVRYERSFCRARFTARPSKYAPFSLRADRIVKQKLWLMTKRRRNSGAR